MIKKEIELKNRNKTVVPLGHLHFQLRDGIEAKPRPFSVSYFNRDGRVAAELTLLINATYAQRK